MNISSTDRFIFVNNVDKNSNVVFNVEPNSECTVGILLKNNLDTISFSGQISDNSNINIFVADFLQGKNMVTTNFKLDKNSNLNWRLASVTSKDDQKCFEVSVSHDAPSSTAVVENYGVCKDASELTFAGISHIKNKCINSKTSQNARIMVFDDECIAKAKPILKIDENEISANHAAVVGRVNDEHLFYLTSRGIPEDTAKQLITYGYLKPILEGFKDEKIKEEITKLIEEKI